VTEPEGTRDLLGRYLRQRAELGEREWYLESGDARQFRQRLLQVAEGRRDQPAVAEAAARYMPESEASAASGSVDEFEALRHEVLGCTRCRLAEGRTTVVFGEGNRQADLLVVGEAPGFEEDRSGRPFVGPAGQLLERMLAAIGFRREDVFICNVLKCRPPQNRDPALDEIASCRPYLRRQVELIAPKVICTFGRFAAQALLDSEQPLGRLRGARHEFMGVPLVATYHPAALLRNEQWKRPAWEDLKLVRRIYDEVIGGKA
jgi:DNA polymerase